MCAHVYMCVCLCAKDYYIIKEMQTSEVAQLATSLMT